MCEGDLPSGHHGILVKTRRIRIRMRDRVRGREKRREERSKQARKRENKKKINGILSYTIHKNELEMD